MVNVGTLKNKISLKVDLLRHEESPCRRIQLNLLTDALFEEKNPFIPKRHSVPGGQNYTGMQGIIVGWGRIGENQPTSGKMRVATVPVISEEECAQAGYKESRVTPNMMCAGYDKGKIDACQGDSGGPMVIDTQKGFLEIAGKFGFGTHVQQIIFCVLKVTFSFLFFKLKFIFCNSRYCVLGPGMC